MKDFERFLIGEAHEDIAALEFPEPDLDRLRRAILEADATSEGLDADALRLQLGQSGFTMTVDAAVLALAEHAGSLQRCADSDQVRTWWRHLVRMLRGGDRDEPADAPAEDLTTPEAWERFEAAKDGEAQDGFPRTSSRRDGRRAQALVKA